MFKTRIICPACGGNNYTNIIAIPYDKNPLYDYINKHFNREGKVNWDSLSDVEYVLNKCDNCDMFFQTKIPDDDFLNEIYNDWLAPEEVPNTDNLDHLYSWFQNAWGADFDHRQLHAQYSRDSHEIMMLSKFLNVDINKLKVLDFGSGWGTWLRVAKVMGCETYGYELSQKASTFTKQFGIQMLDWDFIPQHKFDYINTEQVFEHLAEPLLVLEHLSKALKPGGLIKISVPTLRGVENRIKKLNLKTVHSCKDSMFPVEPLVHINCFSIKSIGFMSNNVGLKIINVPMLYYYSFLINSGLDWLSFRQIIKSLIRPLYRRLNHKNLYVFLTNLK